MDLIIWLLSWLGLIIVYSFFVIVFIISMIGAVICTSDRDYKNAFIYIIVCTIVLISAINSSGRWSSLMEGY